jgi:hypothetical protein
MWRRLVVTLGMLSALLAACAPAALPDFATRPYEPFNREDAVAIALREWRLFGSPTDEPSAGVKPERLPGLWQRVGEYWWIGIGSGNESRWTGKHDAAGRVFPARLDGNYAWSAAFISYVMRIAGAGDRFPYSATHSFYVNAAAARRTSLLVAQSPEFYAPRLGDLLCEARDDAIGLRFADLPTARPWPGHCAMVVGGQPGAVQIVGGNVDDEVKMSLVPAGPDGRLTPEAAGQWFVILDVRYDAEAEPAADR